MSKNEILFSKLPSLGSPQVTSTWLKTKQEFKIQTYNVQSSIPILNALFIQNNVISLPP